MLGSSGIYITCLSLMVMFISSGIIPVAPGLSNAIEAAYEQTAMSFLTTGGLFSYIR